MPSDVVALASRDGRPLIYKPWALAERIKNANHLQSHIQLIFLVIGIKPAMDAGPSEPSPSPGGDAPAADGELVRLHLYDISHGLAQRFSPILLGQQVGASPWLSACMMWCQCPANCATRPLPWLLLLVRLCVCCCLPVRICRSRSMRLSSSHTCIPPVPPPSIHPKLA